MFGLFEKKHEEPALKGPKLPEGFRLGGAVEIDQIRFRVNAGAFNFEPPATTQIIEALGTCDLGNDCMLYRLYLTDDAWIQINTTAGAVDQKILFTFEDKLNPPTESAFDAYLTGANPKFGPATYEFREKCYYRVWGNNEAASELASNGIPTPIWAGPIEYGEEVIHADDKEEDYDLTHYSWLYQRELPEIPGRFEYLFISGERYEDNWLFCLSIGTDITEADLKIV
jgi:hypothetical protein